MASLHLDSLKKFLKLASSKTFAGDGSPNPNPQIQGFIELSFDQGDFSYVDSYTGFYRSRGMEIIYHQNKPVWVATYGGGMIKGQEALANHTFTFLKKAFLERSEDSVRGPKNFSYGEWKYQFNQKGGVDEFEGDEQIFYKDELVFFHKVIGGLVKDL